MFYFCLLKPYKTRLIPFLLVRIISCLDCIDFSQVKHFLFRGCGFKSSQSFLPLTFEYSIVFLLINNVVVKRSTDFNRLAEDFWKGVISFSSVQFSSVQFSSVAQSCPTLCNPMDCSMPGFPVHHQLLEPTQTHVHWVSDAIQPSHLCHPCLLLPSIFSSIRIFPNKSVLCIRWLEYWSFSFSIHPSNEYSGLISFRIDLVWSPFSPRDSQESSPTPKFKSINSLVLNFFRNPTHLHMWLLEKL